MKNIIVGVVVAFLLAGCAIVPTGYGQYGVVLNGPAYSGYGRYGGYSYGGYGYGWGRPTRWVPGYQRWVCENSPRCYWKWEHTHWGHGYQRWVCENSPRCYWTWEPAHYE